MKNKEFYKNEIYDAACIYKDLAVDKNTGEPCDCLNTLCEDCLLLDIRCEHGDSCTDAWKLWLEQDHVEPILDAVEKRYLENVIRPFRKQVTRVCKVYGWYENYAHIRIMIKHPLMKNMRTYSDLPFFNVKKMYLGMKPNEEYTLEELGLFEDE